MSKRRDRANVLILDHVRGWGLAYREDPPGEPLTYKGRLVHLCAQEGEELRPVDLPKQLPGTLPEDLYQARFWPEVDELFGIVLTKWEKLQTGLWIPALGILALLVFLMFSELRG